MTSALAPAAALAQLRAAADAVGFPETTWERVAGPGPASLTLEGRHGTFKDLKLEPGQTVHLRCALILPANHGGVRLAGEALEATVNSLYPVDLLVNGQTVFHEDGGLVAAGPALLTLLPAVTPGQKTTLEFIIKGPRHQVLAWLALKLRTPGLRQRFEDLDLAWARLALADALAVTPAERQAVAAAAALVPALVATEEDAALQGHLRALAKTLAPLATKVAALRVILVGHSHIDMNWLWTWPDTVAVIRRDLRSVLALMEEFPELTFSHSQPATYEVFRQTEPALFEQVLARLREGRWEATTMQWVEGDLNMASGEAQARQLLEGVHYSREVLGLKPTIFHAPDSFGHAGNLPQLARAAGATSYYHHRGNPGGANQWPAYWWEGQDGSRILAFSTPSYNGEIQAGDLARAAIRAHQAGLPVGLHFHGIGDHGGGPSRQNLQALRRFQQLSGLPTAACGTMASYVRQVQESGAALPVHRGESSTIFEGCYTTHGDTKRYNRHGEALLGSAETLAALAGLDARAELRAAWRMVLFNQFHDILDGSAIHEAYEKNREDFAAVVATAGRVTEAALARLHAGLAAGQIAVSNPLAHERCEWVTVPGLTGQGLAWLRGSDGELTEGQYGPEGLGFLARVPAFGTTTWQVLAQAPAAGAVSAPPPLTVTPGYAPTDNRQNNVLSAAAAEAPYLILDGPLYRLYLRRDCGIIVSWYDKRAGRELVGFGLRRASDYMDSARPDLALNVLQLCEEHPHGMSSWQLHEVHTEHSLLRGAETRVIESGPLRVVVEVSHRLRQSQITQRLSFYRDLAQLAAVTTVDWREPGNGTVGVPDLKLAHTARLPDCQAWFETPFGAVRRPADGQESPALRWAAVGGPDYGIALLNDCKYGHDILGTRLRLTLVRSGYDPDLDSDTGTHEIRTCFLPYAGDWRAAGLPQAAAAFNHPLLVRVVASGAVKSAGGATLLNWRPLISGHAGIVLSTLQRAQNSDGILLRLYDSGGAGGGVRLGGLPSGARVTEVNLVEDPIAARAPRAGELELQFTPWQARQFVISH